MIEKGTGQLQETLKSIVSLAGSQWIFNYFFRIGVAWCMHFVLSTSFAALFWGTLTARHLFWGGASKEETAVLQSLQNATQDKLRCCLFKNGTTMSILRISRLAVRQRLLICKPIVTLESRKTPSCFFVFFLMTGFEGNLTITNFEVLTTRNTTLLTSFNCHSFRCVII